MVKEASMPSKLYVIREVDSDSIEVVTPYKSNKDKFLNKRDPSRYEWVKIIEPSHIERTLRLYDDKECICFGDIALSFDEYSYFEDLFMTVTNGLVVDIGRVIPLVRNMKLDDKDLTLILDALAIVYAKLDSLENPHMYSIHENDDDTIDEFDIWDEYRMAIKFFQEECL